MASGGYMYRASHRLRINRVINRVEYSGSGRKIEFRSCLHKLPCELYLVKFPVRVRQLASEVGNENFKHCTEIFDGFAPFSPLYLDFRRKAHLLNEQTFIPGERRGFGLLLLGVGDFIKLKLLS